MSTLKLLFVVATIVIVVVVKHATSKITQNKKLKWTN